MPFIKDNGDLCVIIGFMGVYGSGKDHIASVLKDIFEANGLSVRRIAMADKLKSISRPLIKSLGLDEKIKLQVRPVWQFIGEYMRSIDEDYWIKHVDITIRKDKKYKVFFVPDIRYQNERQWLDTREGYLIYVDRRLSLLSSSESWSDTRLHPSEKDALSANVHPFGVWNSAGLLDSDSSRYLYINNEGLLSDFYVENYYAKPLMKRIKEDLSSEG